jgi:hypothetical protein
MSNALERVEAVVSEMAADPDELYLLMTDEVVADFRAVCGALRAVMRPAEDMPAEDMHAYPEWCVENRDQDLVDMGFLRVEAIMHKRVRDRLAETERDDG